MGKKVKGWELLCKQFFQLASTELKLKQILALSFTSSPIPNEKCVTPPTQPNPSYFLLEH